MKASYFSKDNQDFIKQLNNYNVLYLIVGGEAVIYYGHVRLTGDIDFYYDCSSENAARLFNALLDFWGGSIPGVESPDVFTESGAIIQFGRPPNRIDLINKIDGVTFKIAWKNKKVEKIQIKRGKYFVYYIGQKELVKNKKAAGRHKDLDDLRYLEK
jgi:hypothetical protein